MSFLQKLFAKWLFRSHANKNIAAIKIPGKLSAVKKVFAILPEDEETARKAIEVVKFFESRHKAITLMYHSRVSQVCAQSGFSAGGSVSVIEYFDNDKNKVKLPNRTLREKLKRKEADIVIDFSCADDLFAPLCARMITAKWYAGAAATGSSEYFNLQLSRIDSVPADLYISSLAMVFTQ